MHIRWVDRTIFNATAAGLGDFVVASAVTGYLTPAQSSAIDGESYHYAAQILDGSGNITDWEVGTGAYTAGTTTLARTTIEFSSNSNNKVNFATAPQVMLTALAEDFELELDANTNFYVATTGNDSNTGLSTGQAWKTLQHATDFLASIELNGFNANVNIGAGSFVGVDLAKSIVDGTVSFIGGGTASTTITPALSGICFGIGSSRDVIADIFLQDLTLSGTGSEIGVETGGSGATVTFTGAISFTSLSIFVGAIRDSSVYMEADPVTITGNAATPFLIIDGASLQNHSTAFTLVSTPAWSNAFCEVDENSLFDTETVTITFTGAATGKRFIVSSGGVIRTGTNNLSYFPGDVVGDILNGGQYDIYGQRELLIQDTSFYVEIGGSDTNDGKTIGTAWATLQHAMDHLAQSVDLGGHFITVNIGTGSFVGCHVHTFTGGGTVQILGNGSANTTITVQPGVDIDEFDFFEPLGVTFGINNLTIDGANSNNMIANLAAGNTIYLATINGGSAGDIVFKPGNNPYNPGNGSQCFLTEGNSVFYLGCDHITIDGSGTANPCGGFYISQGSVVLDLLTTGWFFTNNPTFMAGAGFGGVICLVTQGSFFRIGATLFTGSFSGQFLSQLSSTFASWLTVPPIGTVPNSIDGSSVLSLQAYGGGGHGLIQSSGPPALLNLAQGTWNVYKDTTALPTKGIEIVYNEAGVLTQVALSPTVTGNISTGYTVTPGNRGIVATGTFTPAAANGNYQFYMNGGAHAFNIPADDSAIDVLITNGLTAGAITFSTNYLVTTTGDALTTTAGDTFIVSVRRIDATSTYLIKALGNVPLVSLIWSPTDSPGGMDTLSVSDTATRSSALFGTWQYARSDLPQTYGLRYVEFTVVVGEASGNNFMILGVSNDISLPTSTIGENTDSAGYWSIGATLFNGGFSGHQPPTAADYGNGDVIGMVVDLDAHTVKWNKNGGSFGTAQDISTLGPVVFLACSINNDTPFNSVKVNNTFVYTPPTGAVAWNDAPLHPGATFNLIAHGDSITNPGGVQQTYLYRLSTLITNNSKGKSWNVNLGAGGISWNYAWPGQNYPYTLIQDAVLRVDGYVTSVRPSWLIAFAGTNGIYINGNTGATEYSDFQTYIAARLSAGFNPDRIIVCTMLPRTPGIHGDMETDRQAYNTALVGGAVTYGYRLARFDLNPTMGSYGDQNNTTYYQDGVHPTDAGQAILANIIYAAMFP